MLDPPSSPTISSISSSDLDTESTGSFFHDRSTTLGTLMGVNFPAIAFRAPSQHRDPPGPTVSTATRKTKKPKHKASVLPLAAERRRRRRWWRLCRDDGTRQVAGAAASLGEFLDLERRYGDGAFYGEVEGNMVEPHRNGRLLFADGRVLPPRDDGDDETSTAEGSFCRFPVLLTGICSGGAER